MTANPGDCGWAAILSAPLTSPLLRVQMPPQSLFKDHHLLLQQAVKEPDSALPAWSLAERRLFLNTPLLW